MTPRARQGRAGRDRAGKRYQEHIGPASTSPGRRAFVPGTEKAADARRNGLAGTRQGGPEFQGQLDSSLTPHFYPITKARARLYLLSSHPPCRCPQRTQPRSPGPQQPLTACPPQLSPQNRPPRLRPHLPPHSRPPQNRPPTLRPHLPPPAIPPESTAHTAAAPAPPAVPPESTTHTVAAPPPSCPPESTAHTAAAPEPNQLDPLLDNPPSPTAVGLPLGCCLGHRGLWEHMRIQESSLEEVTSEWNRDVQVMEVPGEGGT